MFQLGRIHFLEEQKTKIDFEQKEVNLNTCLLEMQGYKKIYLIYKSLYAVGPLQTFSLPRSVKKTYRNTSLLMETRRTERE